MTRRGFILTEILTGMVLQVGFAIVLCSAFYMILNFSTNAQQGFAANDKGQMVISYFDGRIRNAGLGLWGCPSSEDIRVALNNIPALNNKDTSNKKNLCLPVAIVNNTGDITQNGTVSYDKNTGVYSGNVLTLLYAHRDTNEYNSSPVRLILITNKSQDAVTLQENNTEGSNEFILIDDKAKVNNSSTYLGIASYTNSQLSANPNKKNIKNYTVIESAGVPIYTSSTKDNNHKTNKSGGNIIVLQAFTGTNQPKIYPMSEMLDLECQRLYTVKDSNGYNFVFHELGNDGTWKNGKFYYHTKDILDLYMTLDTKSAIPIFELKVLVSEGINELGTTAKPKDWPGRWTADFNTHKVHVSKAAWKLYNLAPFFH